MALSPTEQRECERIYHIHELCRTYVVASCAAAINVAFNLLGFSTCPGHRVHNSVSGLIFFQFS
jgi:hypothetical protein